MKKQLLFLIATISLCNFSIAQVLLSESFEDSFPPAGWAIVNNGTGNNWQQNTYASFSSAGTNSMLYPYSSSDAAGAWAFTSTVNLNSGEGVKITFDQKVYSGSYPEAMKLTVGNTQTVASQTTVLYNDSNLINTSFAQRIAYFTAPATGSYYFAFNCYSIADHWDLYIDNIIIEKLLTNNAAVTAITSPTNACALTDSEIISVSIKNFGSSTISGFPVKYSINGGIPVTETVATSIASQGILNFNFVTTADLSASGLFNIKVYTVLTGEQYSSNDTATKTVDQQGIPSGGLIRSFNGNIPIPDNKPTGIVSSLFFCGLPAALGLDGTTCKIAYLKIDSLIHPFNPALDIYLISPNNDSIAVSTNNGGNGGTNIINVTFVDSAIINVSAVQAGISAGYYHVENPTGLLSFNTGQNPNGEWKLRIADDDGFGDTGMLYKWTLAFEITSSINEQFIANKNLMIYPNPTNGNINLIYKGEGNQLGIKLLNSIGQLVYNQTISHFSGNYASQIAIENYSKGIYFLEVISGNQLSTKKVVLY